MSAVPHVLVVDDDREIRELLVRFLSGQGFRVTAAQDRRSLRPALEAGGIDLVVLDVMLPDGSGIEICREMRTCGDRTPVILLTALKDDVDRIVGLEVGADDYLGKPFNPRELSARIRAVLRRVAEGPYAGGVGRTYRFQDFTVDVAARRVSTPGGDVDLTGAEFDLLEALLNRPGRVLSREHLLDATRGRDSESFDRSVDTLISRLRRKLRDDGATPVIKTVRNGGYQFTARVTAAGADR